MASLGGLDAATALDRARRELADTERSTPVTAFDGRFGELRREVDATMQAQIARDRDDLMDRVEDRWSGSLAEALPELCQTLLAQAASDRGAQLAAGAGPIAADAAQRHGLGIVTTAVDTPEAELRVDLPGRTRAAGSSTRSACSAG